MSHRQNIYIILYIDSVKKWEAVLLWLCVHHHMAGISEWSVHAIRDKRLGIITLSLNVCGKPLKQKKVSDMIFMLRFAQCPRGHKNMCLNACRYVYVYKYILICMYACISDCKT